MEMLNSLHKELRMWYIRLFKVLSLNMGVLERECCPNVGMCNNYTTYGECVMSF